MFGDGLVSVMVVVEEEGSLSVPFLLEDGDSWTGVTGNSRYDWTDCGIRTGRSERWPAATMVWINEFRVTV